MPDTPKIAKISATINGGEISAESLTFQMDINSFPTIKCATVTPTDDEVKAPLSAELLARIAGMQAARLAGVTEPDINIEAEDGIGGKMNFSGYRSAPVLQSSPVNTVDQFSAIGQDARVDALDLSIYRAGYFSVRSETGGTGQGGAILEPIPAADKGDVTATIDGITDILVGNYEVSLSGEHMPLARQLMAMRHELNMDGPVEIWKTMLGQSEVVFESWDKAFALCNYIAVRLAERIKEVLTTRTPGFWNKMRALMAEFQMFYVPSFDGIGYFERADTKVDETNAEIEVSVSGISVADGSQRLLQVGGVVMMGALANTVRKESSPNQARVIAYAPDPLLPGFIQEEQPPFWLLNPLGVPILGSEVEESAGDTGDANKNKNKKDYDLKKRNKRRQKGLDYMDEIDTVSTGVMTEMCDVIFKEIQLAGSTAVLTLPLDFSINERIGGRAKIKVLTADGSEAATFTAFLTGVTHSVDLRQGKSLKSSTQVRLTHAKY